MKLYRYDKGIVLNLPDGRRLLLDTSDWDALINRDNLYQYLQEQARSAKPLSDSFEARLLPPIGTQEIWAAGVTYLRSKVARMEESKATGGDTFYDKVYEAERPEIFFKGTAIRAVGDGGQVRIRRDSTWDVPEPELTLFIASSGRIVGYTIGNDMSSRSIEGENPLYLPQAKVYDQCAGLGPCLYVPEQPIPSNTGIHLEIRRDGTVVFTGSTTIDQMKRQHTELAEFLLRECSFPQGVFLMTGTCIVPDLPFTLQAHDHIAITIDHIGTLNNTVAP